MANENNSEIIKWRSNTIYLDEDTGEILDKNNAIMNYTIIKTTKHSHVYKSTGNITYTNECRKSNQLKLF